MCSLKPPFFPLSHFILAEMCSVVSLETFEAQGWTVNVRTDFDFMVWETKISVLLQRLRACFLQIMSIKQNLIGGFIVVSVMFLSKLCFFVPQYFKLCWITVLAPQMTKASLTSSRRGWRTRNQKKPVKSTEEPAPFYTCNQSASDG